MQKSRKAFLQRKELEKATSGRNSLYKASLSLVFLLWGLVFLISLLTSRGYDYTGGSGFPKWKHAAKAECGLSSEINPLPDEMDPGNTPSAFREKPTVAVTVSGQLSSQPPSRTVPPTLEEFKGRVYGSRAKSAADTDGGVRHRVEPGGEGYNYASAAKGAKVLAFNRESRGASNILCRDKDKYLRNPCSAEDKFVILELSEETLVDTIETANFEHHSSNPREFELYGSSTYPTDTWQKVGNFTAANVKHAQRFALDSPKWARYLKVVLLGHYGSEFYCTLSVFEVYGVDAVERMLEDWLSVPEKEEENEKAEEGGTAAGTGRVPGDTVLKILMQKVRILDSDLFVLGRYLDDFGGKYGAVFKELERGIAEKDMSDRKVVAEIKSILETNTRIDKEIEGLQAWKYMVSGQLNDIIEENTALRLKMKKLESEEEDRENRSMVIALLFLLLGLFTVASRLYNSIRFCSNFVCFFYSFLFFFTFFFLFSF